MPADPEPQVRDAASVILLRRDDGGDGARVLMGQRGAGAAFMPDTFVFPGGAVDEADRLVPLASLPAAPCQARLRQFVAADLAQDLPKALAAAAVRELWEETGLILGEPGAWPEPRPDWPPRAWQSFAALGHVPAARALTFIFRAITPGGRPRRFDARFFLADAAALTCDPDDFSRASGELSHLAWVPLAHARGLNLPFVTEVVLAEVAAVANGRLNAAEPPASVPFFDNSGPQSQFLRIG